MPRYESKGGEVLAVKGGKLEAYDVLTNLYQRHGELTTTMVVKEAKRLEKKLGIASPLHGAFTWDRDVAAEKFWEIEAATLIRSYQIEVVHKEISVRAFPSVENGDSRSYRHASDVASSPDLLASYRNRLLKQAEQLGEKLRRFDEFAKIVQAIDEAKAKSA